MAYTDIQDMLQQKPISAIPRFQSSRHDNPLNLTYRVPFATRAKYPLSRSVMHLCVVEQVKWGILAVTSVLLEAWICNVLNKISSKLNPPLSVSVIT